ncbi:protein FAM136A-like [Planococcus citri]|uniref:protein FAM136A-like n=1 Tax=Planococcus citri TaxID=170843 RepID=UPI0031F7B819
MEEFVTRKSIEESAKQYEHKVQEAYNDVYKSHTRRIERNMYICATDCCDNSTHSYEKVQNCVDNCSIPLKNAQQYVSNEFQDFQNRVQRCLMVCNDKMKDKMELEKSTNFTDKHKSEFEQCANSCLSKYCDMLPSIVLKIRNTLDDHTVI